MELNFLYNQGFLKSTYGHEITLDDLRRNTIISVKS